MYFCCCYFVIIHNCIEHIRRPDIHAALDNIYMRTNLASHKVLGLDAIEHCCVTQFIMYLMIVKLIYTY